MSQPPLRRLNLSDLVILVAASSIGVLVLRMAHEGRSAGPAIYSYYSWSWKVGLEVSPFLVSTAAGLLVARSLQPRPRWRQLFRQPGTIACLAILFGMAETVTMRVGSSFIASFRNAGFGYNFDSYLVSAMFTGHSVAMVWATLILARAWRPEPSWIDRAGWSLGVLAILLWLAAALSL